MIKKLPLLALFFFFVLGISTASAQTPDPNLHVELAGLPVVGFGQLLTFIIRMIFVIAGLAALIYGLLGGIAWITSGGGKDEIQAARDKIQAAIVGVFILIIVLTIIWTLEQLVFNRTICFGISCDVTIPALNTNPLPPSTCDGYCRTTDVPGSTPPRKFRGGGCDAGGCPRIGGAAQPGGSSFCTAIASTPNCCCF